MTNHKKNTAFDTTGLTANRKALHQSFLRTEIGSASPYALSHAKRANSGYSVGWAQIDLSKKPSEIRDGFYKILWDSGRHSMPSGMAWPNPERTR